MQTFYFFLASIFWYILYETAYKNWHGPCHCLSDTREVYFVKRWWVAELEIDTGWSVCIPYLGLGLVHASSSLLQNSDPEKLQGWWRKQIAAAHMKLNFTMAPSSGEHLGSEWVDVNAAHAHIHTKEVEISKRPKNNKKKDFWKKSWCGNKTSKNKNKMSQAIVINQ